VQHLIRQLDEACQLEAVDEERAPGGAAASMFASWADKARGELETALPTMKMWANSKDEKDAVDMVTMSIRSLKKATQR
jgi:hypothetical protein